MKISREFSRVECITFKNIGFSSPKQLKMLMIFSIKESKVYIQLSLSIHQESRDDIRKNLPPSWR